MNHDQKDDCVFCGILRDDQKKQIIKVGKHVTAIRKHYVSKNTNFMIITNDHYASSKDLKVVSDEKDKEIWLEILSMAQEIAGNRGFGMKFSNGKAGGQTVFHLHAHIYSDEKVWPEVA